jgi:GNAT superfamily N-acetyltransferase
MRRELTGGFELDDDPERLDVDLVHRHLSEQCYWALGRPRDVVEASISGSARVLGVYDAEGAQVGFARMISDGATRAYLADVFVLPAAQGRGLGVELVREAVDGAPYAEMPIVLHTLDAHSLYERFGFTAPSERVMERRRP